MCSAIWVWFLIFDLVSFMIICKLFSFVVFFFFFFFFFCVCVCVWLVIMFVWLIVLSCEESG